MDIHGLVIINDYFGRAFEIPEATWGYQHVQNTKGSMENVVSSVFPNATSYLLLYVFLLDHNAFV